ncbi:MAG: glycoside hydrolase family 88 protein [Fusobacteriaceae bacterium]|nr:glycoside hydrolase family 88 protein [Fusobacteriaceae bacterium]MBN2837786.1 glycoside hydrolase family 88 protein [Fusobacteriaceae bacterium]
MSNIEKYLESYLKNYKPYKGEMKWNYEDGCTLIGVEKMYMATGDKKYYDFIYNYMNKRINDNGKISEFSLTEYNIDNINSGKVLFNLYKETKNEKYRKAIDEVYYQLKIQPRTLAGGFWHKSRYPYQVWLDGLYMSLPFYAQYETEFNNMEKYSDVFKQFKNVRDLMYSEEYGLYYHGYDETKMMNWANKETGLSPNFWLRSIGWLAMALIDTIEVMNEQIFEYHRELQKIFKELIKGILKYQNQSGLWYQVMGKEDEKGNYLESSGTLMFSYAILKGVRLGYLPEEYLENGKKAFEGTIEKYLVDENGEIKLKGICIMAGLNGIVSFNGDRDGSYEYYLSEPVGEDDPKGTGPLMMAYSEILMINNKKL